MSTPYPMPRRPKKRPKRRGYVRPSRAKAKAGWTLRELATLSGTAPRTIRMYLQRGVLPRSRFMGPATRYQRMQLVWLLAIRRLRSTEKLELDAIRMRLQALAPPELESFAVSGPLAESAARALGIAVPPSSPPSQGFVEGAEMPRAPRWARLELALGLELHVRDDASPSVHEMARRIRELCATSSG